MKVIATSPAHIDWKTQNNILKALESAQLIVVNGEGTIHHDRIQGRWLLEIGEFAKNQSIPSVLLNATWDSNGIELVKLARAFNLIAVRDSKSFVELQSFGIASEILPDLSLYNTYSCRSILRKGIGFTDSADRRTSINLDELRRHCEDAKVIPIQYPGNDLVSVYKFFRQYISYKDISAPLFLSRILFIRALQFYNRIDLDEDFLNCLSELKLLVSGRYHACTMAMLAGTPFIASGTNSHKITGLVEDVGLKSWRINTPISDLEIQKAVRIGWETEEKQAIANFLSEGRLKTDQFMNDIKSLL
jgi:polysaccharide pyruvyl transferase WcaK-like protein